MSERKLYGAEYRYLNRLRRELTQMGIGVRYKNRQLHANQDVSPGLKFNIRFRRVLVSNGKTALLLQLQFTLPDGRSEVYKDGYAFRKGLERMIQSYQELSKQRLRAAQTPSRAESREAVKSDLSLSE